MARRHAPTTCTEADDCTHDVKTRTHERNSQLGTDAHEDAPVEERVCSIHGIVYSR
jgi:hypothetical protein